MGEFGNAPMQIGRVVLTVHDLDGMGAFYRDVVGLDEIHGDGETQVLGSDGKALLELRRDVAARKRSPREAGLFHTAFLLPRRADLGAWAQHARATNVPIQGASDHAVSEAIYLSDPEGNGIEIYADRPSVAWPRDQGLIAMRTDRLDFDDLLAAASSQAWTGIPAGATVGHVHLQVGAIAPADRFYGEVLGFDLTARYPGASFFGSGGYHHHLAANIWNSRDAGPRSTPSTGLAEITIRLRDTATLAALENRATLSGVAVEPRSDGLALRDPWNTSFAFVAPSA